LSTVTVGGSGSNRSRYRRDLLFHAARSGDSRLKLNCRAAQRRRLLGDRQRRPVTWARTAHAALLRVMTAARIAWRNGQEQTSWLGDPPATLGACKKAR
jgi:hypothetical protein